MSAQSETMALLERAEAALDDALETGEQLAATGEKMLATIEALNLTCAHEGRKLAAIEQLLLSRLDNRLGPTLRGKVFEDPTLERIRLAMLERPW